jgi:uncharacterized membrane protein
VLLRDLAALLLTVARMTAVLAIGLVALTVPALFINLYFTSLMLGRWPGLRHLLGVLFTTCGADTSSCAIVVQTPYARLFGGAPNVHVGIVWNVALLGLAVSWMVSGRLAVPWPYLIVAAVSVLVGLYLVRALVVDLRQPCPL